MKLWTVCAILALDCGALAVTPATWEHATEADFTDGKFDSTVVSSLGEIRLGREVKILMPAEDAPEAVSTVVRVGKDIYVAGGTEPVIYRIRGGKSTAFAELPGAMVAALRWTGRELLAGTCGEQAGIYRVDRKGRASSLWCAAGVKYVWAIQPVGKDRLLAATGPEGKVFLLRGLPGDPTAKTVYEAGKLAKNILSLAYSKATGMAYAGTDKDGLVVEIDLRAETSRIVLDADEQEVSALQIDPAGGVYAATADGAKAGRPGKPRANHVQPGKAVPQPATMPARGPAKEPDQPAAAGSDDDAGRQTTDETAVAIREMMDLLGEHFGPDSSPSPAGQSRQPSPAAAITELFSLENGGVSLPASQPAPVQELPGDIAEAMVQAKELVEKEVSSVGSTKPTRHKGKGNAVYYIRPDGLVETRFRRPVTILAMCLREGRLYLATGNEGVIYSVSADGDEVVPLADVDAEQVTALAPGRGGEILFATANTGSVGLLTAKLATSGTFTSEALDAEQIAQWGTMRLATQTPGATRLTVATRSGNVSEPADETWSSWSKATPVGDGFLPIGSPAGRFLQYRLTLTGDGKATPVAQRIRIVYQVGNLPPSVTAVTVKTSAKGSKASISAGGAKAFRHIELKASDPNSDKLEYTVSFREVGSACWIEIAKDLKKPKYVWDTRTVGDGTYELLVRASDRPSNPPAAALSAERISNPVLVDNTAPTIQDLGAKSAGGKVIVTCAATDAASRIVSAYYAVDSQDEWTVLAAKDGMFDSDREQVSFELTDLRAGAHRVAVKIADDYGNVAYGAVSVTVGKGK